MNIWAQFTAFSKLMTRRHHCMSWNQNYEGEENPMASVKITHKNQGPFNTHGLMDASVFEITYLGSRSASEGPNQPSRPNWSIK